MKKKSEMMPVEGTLIVGYDKNYIKIIAKDYARLPWMFRDGGEGMAFDPKDLFEVLNKFYKDNF